MFAFIMRVIGVLLVVLALTEGAGLHFSSFWWAAALGSGLMLLGTNNSPES